MNIRISYVDLPEIFVKALCLNKSFTVSKDDNETQPNIIVFYDTDLTIVKERMSSFSPGFRTEVVYMCAGDPSLRNMSDLFGVGAALVTSDNTEVSEFVNSMKTIVGSNLYNAAKRATSWEGVQYPVGDNAVYSPSSGIVKFIKGEEPVRLNKKERAIMDMLCDNIGEYIEKKAFLNTIWGDTSTGSSRSFDVYINRLRHVLDTGGPTHLRKIRTKGYAIINGDSNSKIKNKY